jgi:two-component system chemotaxis sensor kinase CheA
MSKREILNLIFAPGFSTAEKVSAVSGRGVGMDVVKTNITKLKGIVDIESETGQGKHHRHQTAADARHHPGICSCSRTAEAFAVPLNSVLEVVRVRSEDIKTVNGYRSDLAAQFRDALWRASVRSSRWTHQAQRSDWLYIVVVGLAEERLGIIVDSLRGSARGRHQIAG